MKTKAEKDKAFVQRMRVFRHNGLLGQRQRAEYFLIAVRDLDSTDPTSKALANNALYYIEQLKETLKKRIDP